MDSMRQCCLDLMLGNGFDDVELMDCWECLRIVGEMALEFLPEEPPKYVPSIALGPEIEMGFALYYMARSVDGKGAKTKKGRCDVVVVVEGVFFVVVANHFCFTNTKFLWFCSFCNPIWP